MLKHISVKNYALIDHLSLRLENGLTVLTGETGAGKSIILGALSLVLGKRADLKSLRDASKKCVIEATFDLEGKPLSRFFEDHDLDFEPESIIRREITPSGKSRSFINDTPVNLSLLSSLGSKLIDIHSQHDTLLLNNAAFQMRFLDFYANNQAQRTVYTEAYGAWRKAQIALNDFESSLSLESFDLDYQQFLFDELESANLKSGEQAALEEEIRVLESAGDILESLNNALQAINASEEGASQALQLLTQALRKLSSFGSDYPSLTARVESLNIELEDIRLELETKSEDLDQNPNRLAELDERFSLLIRLQKKHGALNEEELIEKRDKLSEQLDQFAHHDEHRQQLVMAQQAAESALRLAADHLTKSREEATTGIQNHLAAVLTNLNMPMAQIAISLSPTDFQNTGADAVNFLFTANKGQPLQSLSKVASGGELSRVMLAIKSIMANKNDLPTIIFDEIDTGVSGETAGKIGGILKDMAKNMQVIAITHLPQIASAGDYHLRVFKELAGEHTVSGIESLSEDARLQELARLLSGEEITDAALANAKTLLGV